MGAWYDYADTGIAQNFGIGDPGPSWADQSCAAWTTGGPLATGSKTYAGIGFMLDNGLTYNLNGWTGLSVILESNAGVQLVLKLQGGGYFGGLMAATVGGQNRTVAFATMAPLANSTTGTLNLALVTDVQFDTPNPAVGFGFAVHSVSLY